MGGWISDFWTDRRKQEQALRQLRGLRELSDEELERKVAATGIMAEVSLRSRFAIGPVLTSAALVIALLPGQQTIRIVMVGLAIMPFVVAFAVTNRHATVAFTHRMALRELDRRDALQAAKLSEVSRTRMRNRILRRIL